LAADAVVTGSGYLSENLPLDTSTFLPYKTCVPEVARKLGSAPILIAAAAYNAIWGTAAIVAPRRLAQMLGFDGRGETIAWRATGVMVLAYAPAYVWAARHPEAARPIVATALFGKSLGAAGWLAGWLTGRFRTRTAVLTLLNDAIWLPGLVSAYRAR
jgi:hypothetical protein